MRFETKIPFSLERLSWVRETVRLERRWKKINSYVVKNLYFDTTGLSHAREKVEGVGDRSKVRLRFYPDGRSVLEVKQRCGDKGRKWRDPVLEPEGLIRGTVLHPWIGSLRPVIYVEYVREEFETDELRVTIDRELRYRFFGSTIELRSPNAVLELKSESKSWPRSLQKVGTPEPFSKYVEGLRILGRLP